MCHKKHRHPIMSNDKMMKKLSKNPDVLLNQWAPKASNLLYDLSSKPYMSWLDLKCYIKKSYFTEGF